MDRLQGFYGAHEKVVSKETDPMKPGKRARSYEMHKTVHCWMCNDATEIGTGFRIALINVFDYAW